jgi:hypothetical protein
MNIVLTIIGLFGIPSLIIGAKKLIFKPNIQFHEILNSFPIISENKINEETKTIINNNYINYTLISKEFNIYVETKMCELDEFLAKLEKFDVSKVKFKKKEINCTISAIKNILTSKAISVEYDMLINTKQINENVLFEPFKWNSFNYLLVREIIEKKRNNLFVFKRLMF